MLIEFKVSNFKSIREEQVFSLVASTDRKNLKNKKEENLIENYLPGLKGLNYLKGAVLYGANASGKSNLLLAIEFMRGYVVNSATEIKPSESTGTKPFLFDTESKDNPSFFEMTFVVNNVRYRYGFSLTNLFVVEEYLYAYPKGIGQKWFSRIRNNDGIYDWVFSPNFKDYSGLIDKTRDNALFLSVTAQFNLEQTIPIYRWFYGYLRVVSLSCRSDFSSSFTEKKILESEDYKTLINNYMKAADLGISDVKVEQQEREAGKVFDNYQEIKTIINDLPTSFMVNEVSFTHKVRGNDYQLPLEVESAGTRRFFSIIAPIIDSLENGYTVFFDELENSMHTMLLNAVLDMFFSKKNKSNAQMVFTSHNPSLLDQNTFRRDQVWFTEKDIEGATQLYSLMEYSPRNNEALGKGYLSGRYGALPFLGDELRVE